MKKFLYFYAGNTACAKIGNVQFHGTWVSAKDPEDILLDIVRFKEENLGVKEKNAVVLVAFSVIGERK